MAGFEVDDSAVDQRGQKFLRPRRPAQRQPHGPEVRFHRDLEAQEGAALTFGVNDSGDALQMVGVEPKAQAVGRFLAHFRLARKRRQQSGFARGERLRRECASNWQSHGRVRAV